MWQLQATPAETVSLMRKWRWKERLANEDAKRLRMRRSSADGEHAGSENEMRPRDHLAVLMLTNCALHVDLDDPICTKDITGVKGLVKFAGSGNVTCGGGIATRMTDRLMMEDPTTVTDTNVAPPRGMPPLVTVIA